MFQLFSKLPFFNFSFNFKLPDLFSKLLLFLLKFPLIVLHQLLKLHFYLLQFFVHLSRILLQNRVRGGWSLEYFILSLADSKFIIDILFWYLIMIFCLKHNANIRVLVWHLSANTNLSHHFLPGRFALFLLGFFIGVPLQQHRIIIVINENCFVSFSACLNVSPCFFATAIFSFRGWFATLVKVFEQEDRICPKNDSIVVKDLFLPWNWASVDQCIFISLFRERLNIIFVVYLINTSMPILNSQPAKN